MTNFPETHEAIVPIDERNVVFLGYLESLFNRLSKSAGINEALDTIKEIYMHTKQSQTPFLDFLEFLYADITTTNNFYIGAAEIIGELYNTYNYIGLTEHVQACLELINQNVDFIIFEPANSGLPPDFNNPKNSDEFMIGLLNNICEILGKSRIPTFSCKKFEENTELVDHITSLSQNQKKYSIGILDDACYSGVQKWSLVHKFREISESLNFSARVIIFVAGASEEAKKLLTDYPTNAELKKISDIKTIGSISRKVLRQLKNYLSAEVLPYSKMLDEIQTSLTFTAYKVPDSISTSRTFTPFLKRNFTKYPLPPRDELVAILNQYLHL